MTPGTAELIKPSAIEELQARESLERLAPFGLADAETVRVSLDTDLDAVVPMAAFKLFLQLLNEMAQGHAVTIIPYHSELTTQQAAEILNVSRPFVIKLLEQGALSYRKVNRHRRIRFDDLMAYKTADDAKRQAARRELTDLAQDLDIDY